MKEKFDITGMTCSACSPRVEKCVAKLEGAKEVQVNLLTNSMQVQYDDGSLTVKDIIDAVKRAGYGAAVKEEGNKNLQASMDKEEKKEDIVREQLEEMKTRKIGRASCRERVLSHV